LFQLALFKIRYYYETQAEAIIVTENALLVLEMSTEYLILKIAHIVQRPMIDIKTGIFTGLNLFEGFILRPSLSLNITSCNDHKEFIETNGSIHGKQG